VLDVLILTTAQEIIKGAVTEAVIETPVTGTPILITKLPVVVLADTPVNVTSLDTED
jgi:hypothetical protein